MRVAAAAFAALMLAPASGLAQAPAAPPAPAAQAKLSVETSKIGEIVANPAGKAALIQAVPMIVDYLEQIKDMTLRQLMPMSQGALTEDSLKSIQAAFDKL